MIKQKDQQFMLLMSLIIQCILIIPIFLFIWRFIIRKIIHPNPIRKYKGKNSFALITGCPWDFPGKNTGVGCHFLHQGIFPTLRIEADSPVSPALQADSLPAKLK